MNMPHRGLQAIRKTDLTYTLSWQAERDTTNVSELVELCLGSVVCNYSLLLLYLQPKHMMYSERVRR